jgi:hypothetical protein
LYPSRYTVFELLSYHAHRWREYKRAAVYLERGLLNCLPVGEDKSLRIVGIFRQSGALMLLRHVLAIHTTIVEAAYCRSRL